METRHAYCIKCKAKTAMTNPKEAKTVGGVNMLKGNCGVCNTKTNLMVGGKK